jgi:hypothetical protein
MNHQSWLDYIDLKEFKRLYNDALNKRRQIFIYRGNEFLVGFAKYVIEHLEEREKQKSRTR